MRVAPCLVSHRGLRLVLQCCQRVNGDRYEGEWRNGRMHGKGVKVMANGDVYNGTWENDKAEGNGVKVRRTLLFVLVCCSRCLWSI